MKIELSITEICLLGVIIAEKLGLTRPKVEEPKKGDKKSTEFDCHEEEFHTGRADTNEVDFNNKLYVATETGIERV